MFLPLTHKQKAAHKNTISAAMNGVSIQPHTMRSKDLSHIQHVFLLLFVRALEKSFRLLFFFIHQLYLHPRPPGAARFDDALCPTIPAPSINHAHTNTECNTITPRTSSKRKSRHKQETLLPATTAQKQPLTRFSLLVHLHPCTPNHPKTH